jgi:hypothetical protein
MTQGFSFRVALVLAGALFAASLATPAAAQSAPKYDKNGRTYYGPSGPNVQYQQGNTRIYVSKRSWLDGGTEVLPGDRKFTDYALPAGEIGAPLSQIKGTAFNRETALPGPFYLPSRQNPWPWNWCVGC